ncbi:MAG: HAD family hydrolase [Puniceicoccaceae bacterium]
MALSEHIRSYSTPIEPLPTGAISRLGKAEGIRAVVFDVYGTLFISGSGDISLARNEDRSPAIVASLETAGFQVTESAAPWSKAFLHQIETARQARKEQGISYPEVRIEEVWQALVEKAAKDGWIRGTGSIELAIVDHECRVNPCWPMPGLQETLEELGRRKLALGIVSNAQFYTPLLFKALLSKPLEDFGLEEARSVWSYIEREGKPSRNLYRKLKDKLATEGIAPRETLYVGNDIRNDIWPAGDLGFRTVLFAGDERSLRWRKEDPDCQNVEPEFIITELDQLLQIIAP